MIYRKDANFPYPILTNTSNAYETSQFILDVELNENTDNYRFEFKYGLTSKFINNLIFDNKADIIFVIKSKDNKFFRVDKNIKYVEIPKNRISINSRTEIQLYVQSNENISFENNNDLNDFYKIFKSKIIVPKFSILAYSNVVIFEGSSSKALDLFERRLNPNLKSDIKIELGNETIVVHYKNPEYQFINLNQGSKLNNMYIYSGLQVVLHRFIINNSDDKESVTLSEISIPENPLEFKLYNLMRKKMIDELTLDNIDEVIFSISDRIIEKYVHAVEELSVSGN